MSAPRAESRRVPSEDAEVSRALERSAVYRVLALALLYPSASTIKAVRGAAERTAGWADGDIAERLRALAVVAEASVPAEVAGAYAATLDRPGSGCSPYEGSYGTAPRLAGKGALLADIAGFYAAFGMTPDDRTAEVEDHIAAELEFMSVLALKEAAALAEDMAENVAVTRDAQRAFLRDHLGQWATAFSEALHATTASAYLETTAELFIIWLTTEMNALGVDVGASKIRQTGSLEGAAPFACPMASS